MILDLLFLASISVPAFLGFPRTPLSMDPVYPDIPLDPPTPLLPFPSLFFFISSMNLLVAFTSSVFDFFVIFSILPAPPFSAFVFSLSFPALLASFFVSSLVSSPLGEDCLFASRELVFITLECNCSTRGVLLVFLMLLDSSVAKLRLLLDLNCFTFFLDAAC